MGGRLELLIGGKARAGAGAVLRSINPADGSLNYEGRGASAADVDEAVQAAQAAHRDGRWRRRPPHERARVLHRVAELIERDAERLSRVQMAENGKRLVECRQHAASAAATFRYYAAVIETQTDAVTPPRGAHLSMSVREPHGVVAAITPWNSPLTLNAQKLAPALAAGNTVVFKPSEVTSEVGLTLARLCLEAGLPDGVLNVTPGLGPEAGGALVAHPGINMLTFTGGTRTGAAIGSACVARCVPAALELGGKSPQIVFADADLDRAVEGVIGGVFHASGQSCIAGSRLLVEAAVWDEVMDRLVERTRALKVGRPDDEAAYLGPVATFGHRDAIEGFVARAAQAGGRLLTGGERPSGAELSAGAYVAPTIVTGLPRDAELVRQEVFGPVVHAASFSDEADLVAQANDTDYGLACGVWTADYRKAWRIARDVQAGTVWINTYKQLSITTPFGGFKQSGLGREKGLEGLAAYQLVKGVFWGLEE